LNEAIRADARAAVVVTRQVLDRERHAPAAAAAASSSTAATSSSSQSQSFQQFQQQHSPQTPQTPLLIDSLRQVKAAGAVAAATPNCNSGANQCSPISLAPLAFATVADAMFPATTSSPSSSSSSSSTSPSMRRSYYRSALSDMQRVRPEVLPNFAFSYALQQMDDRLLLRVTS
jgi:O-acetyl-ADP-ribose deacetylase (regulator of RNase III)